MTGPQSRPPLPRPVACPSCGKPNPPKADWCWVCFGELGDRQPYGREAEPPVDDESARRDRRRLRRSRIGNVILGTVVAISTAVAAVSIAAAFFVISIVVAFFEACSSILSGPH